MKFNKKVPIIIIGFGSIGKRHYKNLLKMNFKNLSVYDPDPKAFEGFNWVDRIISLDYKSLKNYFIAFICSPNNLHMKHALICAKAGCHLFIEKPLSHNLANINKLNRICREKRLITFVSCNMRFHSCLQFIHNYLREEKLGKVYSIQHEFGYYLPYWRPDQDYRKNYAAKKSTGGGIILDDIHEFDLLFWLNNFEKVIKSKSVFGKVSNLEIETEDICLAIFKFRNKVLGLVRCDYLQKKRSRNCKIIGEKGNLFWNLDGNKVILENNLSSNVLFKVKKFRF